MKETHHVRERARREQDDDGVLPGLPAGGPAHPGRWGDLLPQPGPALRGGGGHAARGGRAGDDGGRGGPPACRGGTGAGRQVAPGREEGGEGRQEGRVMRKAATTTATRLGPADHGRPMTYEEFLHSDSQEGYRYELIEGRLVVAALPSMPHESLRKWLDRVLSGYAEAHPDVFNHVMAPARILVPGAAAVTAPEPDVAVYRDFPLHLPLRERRWEDFS